jgi:hypothetical protein
MDMEAFTLGVGSSMTATFVVYLFRNQFANCINLILLRVYPRVDGKYSLKIPKIHKSTPGEKCLVRVRQLGSIINGHLETYDGDRMLYRCKLKGKVTPTRLLQFNYESQSHEHHNYGTGLFSISSDSSSMEGHLSFICATCQKGESIHATLKKRE